MKKNLVGVWRHPILASWFSINNSEKVKIYHYEIFNFKADMTFSFGEYGKSGPLYEVKGRWRLSNDRKIIELFFERGDKGTIDIRDFKGNSFITTSSQGEDFKFIKD